jgi:hypothetical protein
MPSKRSSPEAISFQLGLPPDSPHLKEAKAEYAKLQ